MQPPHHQFAPQRSAPTKAILALCLSVVLLGATIAAYLPAGSHPFSNFDDPGYVTANRHTLAGLTPDGLRWAFTTVAEANWHPLTWLSHMADVSLYGLDPAGHHLTSIALHAANTLLIFLLLRRLTGADWRSFCVAALFGLHPLHVESVAWVAERKDVLCALFFLLSLHCYAGYAANGGRSRYLAALCCGILGLMAKPMAVTLPVILLLLDYWPLGRFTGTRLTILLREKLPFAGAAVISALVTFYAQRAGGAVAPLEAIPLTLRGANALISYVAYLGKTLWPRDLAIFYPFPPAVPGWQAAASALVLGLVTALTLHCRRRHPGLLFGWFWYLTMLLPVIGLVQVGSQAMADRYTYLPSVGLFVMAAWGLTALAGEQWRKPLAMALLACLLLAAVLTRRQLGYWRSDVTLYRHALTVTADNRLARYNLGVALAAAGDMDQAIVQYREALRLQPRDAEVWSALGVALEQRGDGEGALAALTEATRLGPDLAAIRNNLGMALGRRGELAAALREFREALRLLPDFAEARHNLGVTLYRQGETDAALREVREALRLDPRFAEAHNSLGGMLLEMGQKEEAIREFREALRLDPGHRGAARNLAGTGADGR